MNEPRGLVPQQEDAINVLDPDDNMPLGVAPFYDGPGDDAEPGGEVKLLNYGKASSAEGERYASAGPRRRVTADDLDRILG